jgi:hypothetical protein
MADQAEKVILEAEEQPVLDSVGKANAALDSFEKKAESSNTKVIRISDQTRSSVQRLIASLEKQAETYGKTGVERLISQRDQLLQRYSREPQAIDAITKSYQKMIAVEERGHASVSKLGLAMKDVFEGRTNYAGVEIGKFVQSLSGVAAVAAGAATALIGLVAGALESVKSLGQYGVAVRDAELRTGLTAKEVGEFTFAARAAGQEVSVFERMMRGLSQAADDTSKQGEKARATLERMGVSLVDANTGALKPTAQVMEEISEGLAKLPNAYERNAAAMALFKRAGVEAIPVIKELAQNLQIAKNQGWGPSEEEVQRFTEYQRQVAEAQMSWEKFARSIKEPLAATVVVTFKWLGVASAVASLPSQLLGNMLFGGKRTATDIEMGETQGWGYGASMSRQAHEREQAALARNDRLVAAARAANDSSKQLETAEKKLADLQSQLKMGVMPSVNEPVLKQIAEQRQLIAGIKARTEAVKELKDWERQAAEFERKGDESELDAISKIYYQRDQLLKQAAKVKASEAEIAAIRKSADQQAGVLYKKPWEEFEKYAQQHDAERNKKALDLTLPSKDQMKEWEEGFAAQQKIEDIGVQSQRDELRRRASRAERMAELNGGTDEDAAQQAYRTRISLAVELANIEAARISKEDNAAKRAVMAAEAQKDLFGELAQARDQFDEKQAQMQQKREQEMESRIDDLQQQAASLFDVLFNRPQAFGKELMNTVRSAVLKPVTDTLSGAAANLLHPLIYGSDGQGGINGLLRGTSRDPVRVSTDMNTAATMQNSAVMAGLTAILAAGMGVAAPSISSVAAGVPSMSMPSISAPPSFSAPTGVNMPGVFGEGAAGGIAPAGAIGAGSVTAAAGASAAFNPLGLLFPGTSHGAAATSASVFKLGGLSGILGNLKDSVYNSGGIILGPGVGTTAAGIGGPLGTLAGVASSPAAGTAGLLLGLNGVQRQGVGGTIESGLGGALAGFALGAQLGSIGGPMGAAIGAGAGILAGIISSVFFENPQRKAHDDIKSIYGVDIPWNSGTIKQVVQIAQSQFGGDIAVTVRSPAVRQLVMLYSEATGQKMPLSATTPYAGSLAEQGGKLFQQASYQDGQAHVYASNLPTLGGIAAGTYPTPGNPNTAGGSGATYLSLNVSGSDAANFMTGQFVTPQFVTDQAMAAQYSSYGRTQQSANMQLPGLTVA